MWPAPLQLTVYPGPLLGEATAAAAAATSAVDLAGGYVAGVVAAGSGVIFFLDACTGSDDFTSGFAEHPATKAKTRTRQDDNFIFPVSLMKHSNNANRSCVDC